MSPLATLNLGLRYEYYTPLMETNNLQVKWNIDTGVIDPNTTKPYKTHADSILPRVAFTVAPGKWVMRSGFGVFVGPGQTEDQIQPVESDRVSSTISNSFYPVDQNALVANFVNNPNNRSFQPRAYANEYSIPERIYRTPSPCSASCRATCPRRPRMSVARDAICSCAASRTTSSRS